MREASATDPGGNRHRIPGQNGDSGRDSSRDSGKEESVLRWNERCAFLLMPGGVSRAAACDGNWYSVGYNYDTLPGTLSMN